MVRNRRYIAFTSISPSTASIRRSSLTFSEPATRSKRLISSIVSPIPRIFKPKKGIHCFYGYKKVKGNRLSVLVDQSGLPLACTVFPTNVHDSRLYEPTLEAFEISGVQDHPQSFLQMQPTIPGRSDSITRSEESKVISLSIPETGNSLGEGGHCGLIRNGIRNAVLLSGSSAGSRHSKRSFPDMSDMNIHSLDWFIWHMR
jgi:hypothetical protein